MDAATSYAPYETRLIRSPVLWMNDPTPAECHTPEAAERFCRAIGLDLEDVEVLIALHLDTRNGIAGYHTISRGTLDRTCCDARTVFRAPLLANAAKIVLAHNHPSGDPTPGPADISTTRELCQAGKILGIEVVDHVIIGRLSHVSFRTLGLL